MPKITIHNWGPGRIIVGKQAGQEQIDVDQSISVEVGDKDPVVVIEVASLADELDIPTGKL